MLAPQTAFQAYRSDLERTGNKPELGSADTSWLLITHCLTRLAAAGVEVRSELGQQCAVALEDLFESDADGIARCGHERDLRLVIGGFGSIETEAGANAVSLGVRGFAARMAEANAYSIAFTALASARTACTQASDRERGLLAMDQARISRQLGELDVAEELYLSASMLADRSEDQELMARTLLGRGVLARVRGNYPKAGTFFREGLRKAITCRSGELQYLAHQGLMIVSGVTQAFDEGIEHGWAAFHLADMDATREAESLVNLAQLCLDAGYPAASLRAFLSALSRTSVLRIRLSALGGAAVAAGRQKDAARLSRITHEAVETMERSALPFENAQALRYLAAAHLAVGDEVTAERHRQEALKIARTRGFHELEMVCERMEIARSATSPTSHPVVPETQRVITNLETFEPEADRTAYALIYAG